MANIDHWGGFLSYYLHPAYKTFIDGRWLMVGRQTFLDQLTIHGHTEEMESLCDRYGIDYLIQPMKSWEEVPSPDPERWVLAYRDEMTVIALRRTKVFEANARRVCAWYRTSPRGRQHAHWAEPALPTCDDPPCQRLPALMDCCCEP